MNVKNYFQVIFLLLIISKSFGQITLSLDQIYLNSQTSIENCNTVDFGTTANNNLSFYYTLEKSVNQAVGDGTIKVTLKYDSSSSGSVKTSTIVASSLWNLSTQYSNIITANILASEIQVTGSSILLEFVEGGYTYKSCEYPLIKTQVPEFNISPTSRNIPCGTTTASYTFTAVNVHDSPGTTSYSWNVGSGWKYSGGVPVSGTITTTQNFITLCPNLGIVLPSNVSMTPTLDGVSYPTKTSIISRSDIVETITAISGSSIICSGNFPYTLTGNLQTGQNVNWSLSNNSIATLSNGSNNGVTINVTGNGALNLTATISNACGQSYTRTKSLFAGAPPAFAVARGTAESEYCDIKYHYVPFTMADKNPLLNYSVIVFGMPPSTVSSFNANGFVLKFSKTFSGWVDFIVTASNSCGSKGVFREAHIDDCNSIPYGSQSRISEPVSVFKVYPNPSSDVVYLDLADTDNVPEKNLKIEATLYDMLGYEKEKVKIKNNKASIDVSTLYAGLYILRVIINGESETHLISVK